MSEWQPIETAPKDGTQVILAGDFWRIYPWAGAFVNGRWGWVCQNRGHIPVAPQPTHWMPLPDPPASVGRNPEGEDPAEGLRAEHEHAVGEAETPKGPRP